MPLVLRALTPETAAALRDPHGVVHIVGGHVRVRQIVGPACVSYYGMGRNGNTDWWHLSDVELLGPNAVITCLWCASWRR